MKDIIYMNKYPLTMLSKQEKPRTLKQIINDVKYLFLIGVSLLIIIITMYIFEMIVYLR